MADIDKVQQGKRNRRLGSKWESDTRTHFENEGWIIARWTKQVDLTFPDCPKLVNAKSNRFNMRTCGFPDFICYKELQEGGRTYEVIGVESKLNGYLSKDERIKCRWLIQNKIFSKIIISSK